jgi:hypothetical protein
VGDPSDYLYLDWLQEISNLSCTFGEELAKALWCRTSLLFKDIDGDFSVLEQLFTDRPAICTGLKKLEINIRDNWGYDHHDADKVVDAEKFTSDCRSISKYMSLERLSLVIDVYKDDLEDLCMAKGKYGAILGIREFSVSRYFAVALRLIHRFRWMQVKDGKILAEKYKRVVRELLLPHSLSDKTLSQAETYLKARKEDIKFVGLGHGRIR